MRTVPDRSPRPNGLKGTSTTPSSRQSGRRSSSRSGSRRNTRFGRLRLGGGWKRGGASSEQPRSVRYTVPIPRRRVRPWPGRCPRCGGPGRSDMDSRGQSSGPQDETGRRRTPSEYRPDSHRLPWVRILAPRQARTSSRERPPPGVHESPNPRAPSSRTARTPPRYQRSSFRDPGPGGCWPTPWPGRADRMISSYPWNLVRWPRLGAPATALTGTHGARIMGTYLGFRKTLPEFPKSDPSGLRQVGRCRRPHGGIGGWGSLGGSLQEISAYVSQL